MKFTFKIQQYQTEAVASLVDCFEGQLPANGVQYLRDKGLMPKLVKQDVQIELFEKQKTEGKCYFYLILKELLLKTYWN